MDEEHCALNIVSDRDLICVGWRGLPLSEVVALGHALIQDEDEDGDEEKGEEEDEDGKEDENDDGGKMRVRIAANDAISQDFAAT